MKRKPINLEAVLDKGPCPAGLGYLSQFRSARQAWLRCQNPDWLIWALQGFNLLPRETCARIACALVTRAWRTRKPVPVEVTAALAAIQKWIARPTPIHRKAVLAADRGIQNSLSGDGLHLNQYYAIMLALAATRTVTSYSIDALKEGCHYAEEARFANESWASERAAVARIIRKIVPFPGQ